jgi:type I restriction enzyme M protein
VVESQLEARMNSTTLVQKLWNYCNILRDDGLSYGDYVEQLTFLLFLKMADEQEKPPFNKTSPIPKGYGWDALLKRDGDDLEIHYRHTLEELGRRSGMLGVIFRKAQNKIQDPAKLRRLIVDLIDKEQWRALDDARRRIVRPDTHRRCPRPHVQANREGTCRAGSGGA